MLKHLGMFPGLNNGKKINSALAHGNIQRRPEELMKQILAVIFIFGTPVLIALIVFGFSLLRYNQRQRTIRVALEKGVDVTPLLAEEAAKPLRPSAYVLRGLLWGLPGVLVGASVTWAAIRHDIPVYFATFGWIPAAVGAAYLIFYRLGLAQKDGNEDASHPATSLAPSRRNME
jgi:hypothetical protein